MTRSPSPSSTSTDDHRIPTNLVLVRGTLSSEPRRTELPSGDVLTTYEVTTETSSGRLGVPVCLLGRARPPAVHEGDEVLAVGVVRRRFFRAGGGVQSRTEVVADTVARPGTARATRAVAALIESLAGRASG